MVFELLKKDSVVKRRNYYSQLSSRGYHSNPNIWIWKQKNPTNLPPKANIFLKAHFKPDNRCTEEPLKIIQFNLFSLSHLGSYLLMPGGSSFTTTLLLHAMRSLSVAIWLRGALWCIWRTPSIWPLLRRPTFGGDATSKPGLRRAKEEKGFLHF